MRIALIGLVLASACSSGSATPQGKPRGDAKSADADPGKLDGTALYQTFCAQCHGADAKGYKADNAPSLVNATFLESASDEFIHRSIFVGRPGTSMAGYGKELGGPLDKDAIERIVKFLRAQGPQAKVLATPASAGDAARGATIYARDCQKCHGDASTRVTAVHLANPQFLAVATDAFIRHAIAMGRPGTPMEPFGGKLSAQDLDDVVAFVRGLGKPAASVVQPEGQLPAPTGKEPLVLNPTGKEPAWKQLRSDPNSTRPRYVSVAELKQALDEKRKIAIIDARPASDWMRAHIAGAVSIPYHDLARLDELPKDTWAIAYCACPHHLSGIIVDALWKRGHKRALVLDEGVLEWHRRLYPMAVAPGVQPPPAEDHGSHAGHAH